ncbi:acyl-CoA dehydrogenase family protein [Nocardioides sp. NPDC051685]|uniref:acyl-CoA dehydrogenase family protein n=1 Tax=Nocardioides sp. NPDC051685 TaxID=3364334 RepID=UPI0037AA0E24
MMSQISTDAATLGQFVTEALAGAGGLDVFRAAEKEPGARAEAVEKILTPFGVWDLDPHADAAEFEAAATVARAAGSFAVPYPVCERLASADRSRSLLLVAGEGSNLGAHADLDLAWTAVDPHGHRYEVKQAASAPLGTRLGAFATRVDIRSHDDPTSADGRAEAAALMTLQGWWLLGLLERCVADTSQYVQEREQFGRRLAAFQAVGFSIAEISVEVHKLEELAKYTLWSQWASTEASTALVDALALRAASLEAAERVLRGTHQLHGAMGFCDETDVSVLSRASHLVRRLPIGVEQTFELLTDAVADHGLAGPFADPAELA